MAEASDFERKFHLSPALDLEARVERAESLLRLFIAAALGDREVEQAGLWTGSIYPTKNRVPLPSHDAVEAALDAFRDEGFLAARRADEQINIDNGLNPDGTNIQ